jgi:hypothetical protein
MDTIQFGKSGFRLDYLSEMKKSEFEKKFEKQFDVKTAWKELQKELKSKGYSKKSK